MDQSGRATWVGVGLLKHDLLSMIDNMKQYLAAISVLLVAALAAPALGDAARDRVIADSAALGEKNSQLSSITLKNDVPMQSPIAPPSASASSSNFQDVPSISGRYSIGGRTLLPYIGAGFSGGYSSEFNRSLGGGPPALSDFGLRSQLGHSVSPNEFQLGIRIPF